MRLWSKFVDEGLFEGVTEISFSAMFRERMKSMTPEMRERRFANIGDPRRRDRFMSTYEHGVNSPFVLHAICGLRARVQTDGANADRARPVAVRGRSTLADINMMPFVARLSYLGLLEAWTGSRPHINAWWSRIQNWPSFRRGLADLITETEFAEMRTHGLTIRDDIQALIAKLRGK